MKRWMLITLSVLLLAVYGIVLTGYDPYSAPTFSPEELHIRETVPDVTEQPVPTQPELPETQPDPTQATVDNRGQQEVHTMPAVDPEYLLTARHAFVYDCKAGALTFVLGDMSDRIAPASLTKLLTAWVVRQYLPLDMVITCGEETTWIDPQSSLAWVAPGDQVPVSTLLQGMMMQSGNDAAYAAAVATGRFLAEDPDCPGETAISVFMEEVNRKAAELGLLGTHFDTPDGLDTPDHLTTPNDLLQMALLVMEDPVLRHYASLSTASIMYDNGKSHTYQSTNFLLQPQSKYYCPDACGLKTGTTSKAGSCLMALFHNGDGYIIIGVFGCPRYEDRFADALQLYARYG